MSSSESLASLRPIRRSLTCVCVSLHEKLDEQLDRIRFEERKRWWKQKERAFQSIQAALIRLKDDVRSEEEIYKVSVHSQNN